MLSTPWIAGLLAVFLWWFSTGAILVVVKLADRRPPRVGRLVTLAFLPVAGLALWGIAASADDASLGGVYHAFLGALALWGYVELAFLTGVLTGPVGVACPARVPEWERFLRAWGTIAHKALALTALLVGLGIWLWDAANPFAFLTFAVLFGARLSAELNLFLGVPKINAEFLPARLSHLPSHFREGPATGFLPVSVAVLAAVAAGWLWLALQAPTSPERVGHALLFAMTALAALEHLFMVARLPDEKLWRWMLPATDPTTKKKTTTTEDAHGL